MILQKSNLELFKMFYFLQKYWEPIRTQPTVQLDFFL